MNPAGRRSSESHRWRLDNRNPRTWSRAVCVRDPTGAMRLAECDARLRGPPRRCQQARPGGARRFPQHVDARCLGPKSSWARPEARPMPCRRRSTPRRRQRAELVSRDTSALLALRTWMIEARADSSVRSRSTGVRANMRRICERSTPLESISGIGKGSVSSATLTEGTIPDSDDCRAHQIRTMSGN